MSRESRSTAGDELASSRAIFVTALEGGDVETACAVYTHDATLVPPAAARLKGRDAIERFVFDWCPEVVTQDLRFVPSLGESDAILWGAAKATGRL